MSFTASMPPMASADLSKVKLTSYHIPLSAVAQWPAANFTNPQTRSWLIPFSFALQVVTTIVFAGRLWARVTKRAGAFGADDGLIIISWVFGTGFTALVIFGISDGGFDRHVWDQQFKTASTGGLVGILAEAFFLLSTCSTKISILLFYRRLVDRSYSKWIQLSIYISIGFTVAFLLSFLLFLIFFCSPITSSWQSLDLTYAKEYKCADRAIVDPLVGLVSAFSDIYAIAIPEIVVSRLKMPKKQKLVLYAIFGAGSIVVIAAIIRTGFFIKLHTDPKRDITWTAYDIFVWTDIETQFAIICACAPALKGFFSSYFATGNTRKGTNTGMSTTAGFDSMVAKRGTTVYDSKQWPLSNSNKAPEKPLPPTPLQRGSTVLEPGARWQTQPRKKGITVTETIDVVSLKTTKSMDDIEKELTINERSFFTFD